MALVIETRSSHGSVSRTHLRAGTTRVVVRPGDTFRLYDEDTGKAPAKAVVKQLDNSILVDNLADDAHGADQPQAVELLGFYSSCSVSSPCHLELPETTSGTVDITPATGAIGAPLPPPMNIEYSNRNSNRNTLLVRQRTSEVSKTSAEAAEIVEKMHEMIKRRLPNRANKKRTQAQLQKDIETIEKIHRLDGYSYAEINAVMKWSQEDDFWSQNILSTAKLRKQFDKLVLRMRAEQKKKRDNIAFI